MTLYCRTDTRAEADALLPADLSLYDEDGNPRNYAQDGETIVDVLGAYMVSQPTEDTEAVVDERFHFNVYNPSQAVADGLAEVAMSPAPSTPARVLA